MNSKNKIDFFELFGLKQRLLPFPTNDSNVPLIFLYVFRERVTGTLWPKIDNGIEYFSKGIAKS